MYEEYMEGLKSEIADPAFIEKDIKELSKSAAGAGIRTLIN